jgi:hypothetical protein
MATHLYELGDRLLGHGARRERRREPVSLLWVRFVARRPIAVLAVGLGLHEPANGPRSRGLRARVPVAATARGHDDHREQQPHTTLIILGRSSRRARRCR